jgi:hypothetical protein
MAAWIRIYIPNADPDPGSLKSTKKEGKKTSKRKTIRHKKNKKQCNWHEMRNVTVTLFSLKAKF